MDESTQTKIVSVYRDASKEDLITEIPIIDGGMETSAGNKPSDDETMIYLAKMQLRASQGGDVDAFHYEVNRTR